MTKIFIGILIILFVIGCIVIASSNIATKINSTRAVEAIAGLLDQDGNVSIEQYSGGVKWVKLDNTNKQIQLYDDTGALLTYIGQGETTIYNKGSINIQADVPFGSYAIKLLNASGTRVVHILTNGFIGTAHMVQASNGFNAFYNSTKQHTYWHDGIKNDGSGQPVYITDAEGLQINALAGTGNAFVCVDANGKLYRSATACL